MNTQHLTRLAVKEAIQERIINAANFIVAQNLEVMREYGITSVKLPRSVKCPAKRYKYKEAKLNN